MVLSACNERLSKKERHSKIISDQSGRMTVLPASNGYPPLIIDTISGCVTAVRSTLPVKDAKGTGLFDDLIPPNSFYLEEVTFEGGANPCRVMRQVPVVDTIEDIE